MRLVILLLFLTCTKVLSQNCSEPCYSIVDQIRGKNYGQRTFEEMKVLSDSIDIRTIDCPSCLRSSYTFWGWACHQFRYGNNYQDQYKSLQKLDSVYHLVDWTIDRDAGMKQHCTFNIRNAHYHRLIGDFNRSTELFQYVVDTILRYDNYTRGLHISKNISYQNLSNIASIKGNTNEAIDYLTYTINDELAYASDRGRTPIVWSIYAKRGQLKYLAGQYKEALEDHLQTFAYIEPYLDTISEEVLISRSLPQIFQRLIYLGKTCIELDENDIYRRCRSRLASLAIKKDQVKLIKLQLLDARKLAREGKHLTSIDILNEVKSKLDQFPKEAELRLETDILLAKSYQKVGDFAKSDLVIDRGLDFANAIRSGSLYGSDYVAFQRLSIESKSAQGDEEGVLRKIKKVLAFTNERLDQSLYSRDHYATLQDISPLLEQGIEIAQSKHDLALVFNIIEYVKARQLEKTMLNQKNLDSKQNDLISSYKIANASLQNAKVAIALGDTSITTKNSRFELSQKVAKLQDELNSTSNVRSKRTSLSDFQNWLGIDESYITAFAGANEYHLLHITGTEAKYYERDAASINAIIELLRKEMSNPTSLKVCNQLGKDLYQNLLGDIAINSSLTLALDGQLHAVPLELANTNNRYLVEDYNITYVPSASIAKSLVSKRIKDVAVINPTFANTEVSLASAAEESVFVSDLFGATLLSDQAANKKTFTSSIKLYGLIHLATHADGDSRTYNKAYIQLTPSESDNGKLYFDNLSTLELDAELVALSACKTGIGKIKNSEGAQSLGTQILANGSRSVLSSLWSISDQTTSGIVKSFYLKIKEGLPKDVALADAKREYLSQAIDLEKHPHYWAGMVLTGSNASLNFDNSLYLLLAGVGILLVLLLGFKYFSSD